MRFFAGGLNHAKTMAVHNPRAKTTSECVACQAHVAVKRAEASARTAAGR